MSDFNKSDNYTNKEQADQAGRISVLESKYDVIAKNTEVVIKLASKVSLLLTIMSFVVIIVTGGAIYTFTALSNFKDVYAEDRMQFHTQIVDSQDKNRELIQDSIHELEQTMDNRLDDVERNISIITTKIDSFHGVSPTIYYRNADENKQNGE